MSRKIKYDVKFKLQVVHQILKGKESSDSSSQKLGIEKSLIKREATEKVAKTEGKFLRAIRSKTILT